MPLDRNNPDFFAAINDLEQRVRTMERNQGEVLLNTTNFNGILSPTEKNVQKAMDKLDDALNGAVQVFEGALGGELTGQKSISTTQLTAGMTNNGWAVYVSQAGWYYIHANQLITINSGAVYFNICKNGVVQNYAYKNAVRTTEDCLVDNVVYLNAGDYITITITGGSFTTVWSGSGHSNLSIFKISQGMKGDQGAKGAQWKGAWSNSAAYVIDDIVSINGSAYICILANTNQSPPNGTYWQLLASKGTDGTNGTNGTNGAKGMNWKGTYNPATAYVLDDAVAYNGASYICIQAGTGKQPDTNPTYWAILAQKGGDGAGVMYAVGDIYITENAATDPAVRFGGTWIRYAAGRVLVGYDSTDTDFNAGGKTGGAKAVTLDATNMPPHYHSVDPPATNSGTESAYHSHALSTNYTSAAHGHYSQDYYVATGVNNPAGVAGTPNMGTENATHYHTTDIAAFNSGTTGGSGGVAVAHNNLQPFITVYMWKRTA